LDDLCDTSDVTVLTLSKLPENPRFLNLGMNGLPGAEQVITCAAEAFKSEMEWRG